MTGHARELADIGIVGLGVMGENLALNLDSRAATPAELEHLAGRIQARPVLFATSCVVARQLDRRNWCRRLAWR